MDRDSIQERFGIIGTSDAIRNVIDRARQVARTDISVLLQGESGVGKELIAEVIHQLSIRRHEQMVIVNCGAIPEGLIESELFGAEKGAYTGAVQRRNGYFEEADGSTIFLDEIGEMPMEAQVRLLRVLETGKFSRVGSSQQQQADVRVVAATNKNLAQEVRQGRFRKDLYYRLSTVLIDIPPLRDRREDIMPIFESFLHRFAQEYRSPRKKLTEGAETLLKEYEWPGNVRELRNVAEQAVVLLRQEDVTADDLRPYLRDLSRAEPSTDLMPVRREEEYGEPTSGIRERELLYRAILEMRMEMRDMKDQLSALAANIGVIVPRDIAERSEFPHEYDDFIVVRDVDRGGAGGYTSSRSTPDDDDYESVIEDVVYEVEHSGRADDRSEPGRSPREATNGTDTAPQDVEPVEEAPTGDEPDELPTLEQAEQQLISEALKRFDGNRRKTAQALGISERTLYRKLKDIDEDL